jgi:predicted transcriptional regulator
VCRVLRWAPRVGYNVYTYYAHSRFRVSRLSLGDLQSDILGALQKLGKASAREVMKEISSDRKLAYTTVSTVLDRLHRKGLVKRTKVTGKGGAKYVYSYAATPSVRASLVQKALGGLVSAFGPSVVPTIYDSLERISNEEFADLKKKVAKGRR